jgi:hypothetical protein
MDLANYRPGYPSIWLTTGGNHVIATGGDPREAGTTIVRGLGSSLKTADQARF